MSSKTKVEERKLFKDWFDRSAAKAMAKQIKSVMPEFNERQFVSIACKQLGTLEFHGRVQQFSKALARTLPTGIPQALAILKASLPEPLPDCEAVTDGWLQWPVGQFIADYGLDHFDASMDLMIALTQRFSAEFAIRPFVEHYPEKIFVQLLKLTEHSSPHVRRLCSEGIRTRLPWGRKLHALISDPSPIFPILEKLKDDNERYVLRSVANNLNDIGKDNPQALIRHCQAWSKHSTPARDWVIKHALRSLIKAGNPQALKILGYRAPAKLTADILVHKKSISIGDTLELTAHIANNAPRTQPILLDYIVHYVRKGNKINEKVFKWTTLQLQPNRQVTLNKRHSMKVTTVRALYPGKHTIELQANGVRIAQTSFKLMN